MRQAFVAAIVLYAITAWYSSGYHASDEHHQVIAFAQHRLGDLPVEHLAWEHERAMRPSALPWIAVGVMLATRAVGLTDPMMVTFILRAITALLALLVLHRSLRVLLPTMAEGHRIPFIVITWSLWFVPFQLVRYSGETWSGILFFLGMLLALHEARTTRWPMLLGVCLMASMWLRPPMAVAVAGLLAWLVGVRGESRAAMVRIMMGIVLMSVILFIADSLFYGHVTFSPWNYSLTGISGPPEHMRITAMPWWCYPPWVIKYALPPIGLVLLAALAILIRYDRRHPLVWCILPFLIAHSWLPHKELRFLYPLAMLTPWMTIAAWAKLRDNGISGRIPRWMIRTTITFIALFNIAGLAVVMTQPAGSGNMAFVHSLRTDDDAPVTCLIEPAEAWRIVLPPFYRAPVAGDTAIAPHTIIGRITTPYVIAQAARIGMVQMRTDQAFIPVAESHPDWARWSLHQYHWGERAVDWTLYRVEVPVSY